jgi:sarcosine oxidase subunit alpha
MTYNKGEKINVLFEGKKLRVYSNIPIAISLLGQGVHALSRSYKFNRPRGIFCLEGRCSSCLVRINGIPNVYACKTFPSEGMLIERQHKFTRASNFIFNFLDKFTPADINVYNKFTFSKTLNKFFTNFLHNKSRPKLPNKIDLEKKEIQSKYYEVAIIGGGPSGISAASTFINENIKTCLIDENIFPFGHLAYDLKDNNTIELESIYEKLKTKIDIFSNSQIVGFYNGNEALILSCEKLTRILAKKFLLATGASRPPIITVNNDLPGIISYDAICKMIKLYDIFPYKKVLIVGHDRQVVNLVDYFKKHNITVTGIVSRKLIPETSAPIFSNCEIIKFDGRNKLQSVFLNNGKQINCDLAIICSQPVSRIELPRILNCHITYEKQIGYIIDKDKYLKTDNPNVYVMGRLINSPSRENSIQEGKIASLASLFELTNNLQIKEALDHELNLIYTKPYVQMHNMSV